MTLQAASAVASFEPLSQFRFCSVLISILHPGGREPAMFIVESQSSRAARKMSYLMAIVLLLAPGALLTMHFYIRPRPPSPPGWRIFGFPRRR